MVVIRPMAGILNKEEVMRSRMMAIGIACAVLLSAALPLQAADQFPLSKETAPHRELPGTGGDRSQVQALGTEFTFQGQIKQNGSGITGNADIRLTVYDDAVGGSQVVTPLTLTNVSVSNGIFTRTIDFGPIYEGFAKFVQIEVRFPAGSGNYTSLSPRQPLLAVPYAMGLLPGANVTGTGSNAMLTLFNMASDGEGLYSASEGTGIVAEAAAGNGLEGYSHSPIATGVYGENNAGGHGTVGRVTGGGIGVLGDGTNTGKAAVFARGDVELVDNCNLVMNGKASFGAATRQMIDLWEQSYGIGVQASTLYNRVDTIGGFAWHQGGQHVDTPGDPGPGGTRLMYLDSAGRLMARNGIWAQGLGINPNPLAVTGVSDADIEFRVNNAGEVFADGTFHPGGADFAELLPAEDGLEPGDALVIGRDGKLTKSTKTYQTSVVGVYSTQPGVLGGSNDVSHEGKAPLAVVGVVPVKVTDENGPIAPGDLLTTSSVPGLAMKASEITMGSTTTYPSGSIIGKALSGLESGQGTIQVLLIAK